MNKTTDIWRKVKLKSINKKRMQDPKEENDARKVIKSLTKEKKSDQIKS